MNLVLLKKCWKYTDSAKSDTFTKKEKLSSFFQTMPKIMQAQSLRAYRKTL